MAPVICSIPIGSEQQVHTTYWREGRQKVAQVGRLSSCKIMQLFWNVEGSSNLASCWEHQDRSRRSNFVVQYGKIQRLLNWTWLINEHLYRNEGNYKNTTWPGPNSSCTSRERKRLLWMSLIMFNLTFPSPRITIAWLRYWGQCEKVSEMIPHNTTHLAAFWVWVAMGACGN